MVSSPLYTNLLPTPQGFKLVAVSFAKDEAESSKLFFFPFQLVASLRKYGHAAIVYSV